MTMRDGFSVCIYSSTMRAEKSDKWKTLLCALEQQGRKSVNLDVYYASVFQELMYQIALASLWGPQHS
jgi:hypothetical protein